MSVPVVNQSIPSKQQIEKLKQYLKEFYSGIIPSEPVNGWSDPMNQEYLNEFIADPLQVNIHNFHRTNTDLLKIDEGYPIAHRNNEGIIVAVQLREIDSDKLLLGCGNNPTTICYHYPQSPDFEKECISFGCSECWSNTIIKQQKNNLAKGKTHEHNGFITIDPSVSMNPTIVTYFGWYKIPNELIPENSISEIYTEGISLSGLPTFIADYEKLTGKVYDFHDVIDIM